MARDPKTGPFSSDELLTLWKTLTDPLYWQPLVEQGEGFGLEVFTQQMAQMARASEAIDRTTQALFIMPWSGQSDLPGRSGARAEATLEITRTSGFDTPLTFTPALAVIEVETDHGDDGGVEVETGRRYYFAETKTLGPGEFGPVQVMAIAEREGYGYNNPRPGTLVRLVQVGAKLFNDLASVSSTGTTHRLTLRPAPDVLTPDHVGQYIRFTGGSNAGRVARMIGYEPPVPNVHGGIAALAKTGVYQAASAAFIAGEEVAVGAGTTAVFVHQSAGRIILERVNGPVVVTDMVTGAQSGAVTTVDAIDQAATMVAETNTASWEVQEWGTDLGVAVTNPSSPSGGRAPVLEELGAERDVARASGESDESYRQRIHALPDVVSPNAIRRTANRILAPYGLAACLREVGLALLRGLLLDGDPLNTDPAVAYACDFDHVTLSGAPVGTFIEGELVTQTSGSGVVASGRACVTAPNPSPTLTGVARVEGTFQVGLPIVGQVSGATMAVVGVSGGLRPEDRFKVLLDYEEFRAFFMIGVPLLTLGDFGTAFDVGASNAFDVSPYFAFFDGFPLTAATIRSAIWRAVDKARAGGVGFDLYVERIGCF